MHTADEHLVRELPDVVRKFLIYKTLVTLLVVIPISITVFNVPESRCGRPGSSTKMEWLVSIGFTFDYVLAPTFNLDFVFSSSHDSDSVINVTSDPDLDLYSDSGMPAIDTDSVSVLLYNLVLIQLISRSSSLTLLGSQTSPTAQQTSNASANHVVQLFCLIFKDYFYCGVTLVTSVLTSAGGPAVAGESVAFQLEGAGFESR
ncbi:hypothetical protein EVAR_61283_1 [Eumeta japonica]|uniref:Uncharacterized protein n=1 Tax=Eumeta variegata TaxID=151549 RepID=A0A4C1XK53_EUMVA|nr:hypothetical protein EVAR_61283_1 [Eumeta japonica]